MRCYSDYGLRVGKSKEPTHNSDATTQRNGSSAIVQCLSSLSDLCLFPLSVSCVLCPFLSPQETGLLLFYQGGVCDFSTVPTCPSTSMHETQTRERDKVTDMSTTRGRISEAPKRRKARREERMRRETRLWMGRREGKARQGKAKQGKARKGKERVSIHPPTEVYKSGRINNYWAMPPLVSSTLHPHKQ